MLRLFFFKHSCHQTREDGAVPFNTSFTIRAARNEILAVGYSYFCKVRTGLLNGSDKIYSRFHQII
jgi:hypothetical protein